MHRDATGISGNTLKWIAIVTMFIDHFAAVILSMYIYVSNMQGAEYETYKSIYLIMRGIGRLAFPIFIFLLVEGIRHTSNARKYGTRLLLFAIVSEIPFNYAFNGLFFIPWKASNVFFTLFLGFVAIECTRAVYKYTKNNVASITSCVLFTGICMALASFLGTDYGAVGVITIVCMYMVPYILPWNNRSLAFVISIIPLLFAGMTEAYAIVDTIFIAGYNGTRGKQMKYFFYVFYPVHLLIFGLIARNIIV